MTRGVEILNSIENPGEELAYLINLGRYICVCVRTGIHVKQWYLLTSRLKAATRRERVLELIGQIKELMGAEYDNAQKAIPLVERDSRLGWGPSMDYVADGEHIRWKLRHIDYVMEHEVGCYEAASSEKWFPDKTS